MRISELIIQAYQGYADTFFAKIPALSAALVILAVFVLVAGLIRFMLRHRRASRRGQLIGRITQVFLITVGVILALGILGVNLTGLVAGLGLISVGISFALQDLLVNFLAGLELLSQAAFETGDIVFVGDVQGTVKSVGGRTVRLESNTGERLYVPNRDFLLKPVRVLKVPRGEYLVLTIEVAPQRVPTIAALVTKRLERLPSIAAAGIETHAVSLTQHAAKVEIFCRLSKDHPPRAQLHARGLELLADLVADPSSPSKTDTR